MPRRQRRARTVQPGSDELKNQREVQVDALGSHQDALLALVEGKADAAVTTGVTHAVLVAPQRYRDTDDHADHPSRMSTRVSTSKAVTVPPASSWSVLTIRWRERAAGWPWANVRHGDSGWG